MENQENTNINQVKYCKKCNFGNEIYSQFCTNCGNDLNQINSNTSEKKYCGMCGTQNKINNSFCTNCGFSFNQNNNLISQSKEKPKKFTNIILSILKVIVTIFISGTVIILILLGTCLAFLF